MFENANEGQKSKSTEGVLHLNAPGADWAAHEGSQCFIEQIQEERRKGYGFVPFIGAGFSVPSGVPIIQELSSYLQRCILWSLRRDEHEYQARWHPRTDQWPPFVDRRPSSKRPIDWSQELLERVLEAGNTQRGSGPDPEMKIIAQGYGASVEWRNALLFLSRLTHERRDSKEVSETKSWYEEVELGAPLREIVDACLRSALKDKHPTIGHRMLAVLAGALRLDIVLTTNFDDLLERAFRAARNPLEVFDVHLGDNLPNWAAVSEARALVKLHGHRYSLRADYSLDELPSEVDKQHFLEYLSAGSSESEIRHKGRDFRNHLLMIGFSGQERRTRAFIEYAWEHLSHNFRVFWLCYSEKDVEAVRDFTLQAFKNSGRSDDPPLSIVLRHTNVGLFLLELYQTLRLTLPPSGCLFPSVSRLTFPPLPSTYISKRRNDRINAASRATTAHVDSKMSVPESTPASGHTVTVPESRAGRRDVSSQETWCKRVEAILESFERGFAGKKLIVASSNDHARGVTSACSQIYRDKESSHVCLWIDMNEVSDSNNLFEVILEASYFRLGQDNWIPVYRETDERGREMEITRLINSVNKKWILFLNARETPGVNTPTEVEEAEDPLVPTWPHGWLDSLAEDSQEEEKRHFCNLIAQLCGPGSPHLSVILLCRNATTIEESVSKGLFKVLQQNELLDNLVELTTNMPECFEFPERKIVIDAIEWTEHGDEPAAAGSSHLTYARRRFLHCLVLMQRPRLLATIWSEAVSLKGSPACSAKIRLRWLVELERRGLIRWKEGGFIWMHSRCRQLLRKALNDPAALGWGMSGDGQAAVDTAVLALKAWLAEKEAAEVHSSLAHWYEKVLNASESPSAIFEAVYHLCRAAQAYLLYGNSDENALLAIERINAACSILGANLFLIQTRGYARGSCRRLDHIRVTLCDAILSQLKNWSPGNQALLKASVADLQRTCSEVMRAVAREVGEVSKAYLRHYQLGMMFAGKKDWAQIEGVDYASRASLLSTMQQNIGASAKITMENVEGEEQIRDANRVSNQWLNWLRWLRWSARLGILARSYAAADSALRRSLFYACANESLEDVKHLANLGISAELQRNESNPSPETGVDADSCVDEQERIRRQAFRGIHDPHQIQALRVEAARVIEKMVELLLLRHSLTQRLQSRGVESLPPPSDVLLDRAHTLVEEGLILVARIRSRTASADQIAQANWCRCRLLLHKSLCFSRRYGSGAEEDGGLQSALGLLADAEASLKISDPHRHRSEIAIIELHRAEVRLDSAETVPIGPKERKRSFAQLIRELENENPQMDRLRQIQRLRHKFDMEQCENDLRRAKAFVADGIRFLNRAEPILRERRRNVWLTTWFFERRVRSIAMSLWASVFDSETPIPFLGLEAAAADTDTLADSILEDARRMISVDAYRMATIVDAYASCAKALQIRLLQEKVPSKLQFRLAKMRDELSKAIRDIRDVTTRRNNYRLAQDYQKHKDSEGASPALRFRFEKSKIDPLIDIYLGEMTERAETIVNELAHQF